MPESRLDFDFGSGVRPQSHQPRPQERSEGTKISSCWLPAVTANALKCASNFLCATTVKTRPDGKLVIKLVPAVKQQNRMNAAAFTEETLRYFDEKTVAKPIWLDSTDQVRLKGQLLFMNVVQAVSEACGIGVEELEQNIQVMR